MDGDVTDEHDHEARSFRTAMRGVRRLPDPGPLPPGPPKPAPRARFRRADERQVLIESLLPPDDESVLDTGEELAFRRAHIPQSILTRLRRGQYRLDAELDLHGLTAVQARLALAEFLAEALLWDARCVRIVHGKGRGSGPRGPVLKNLVNKWLQRSDAVLAFGSARRVDGGTGAVYVLLKSR